MNISLIVSIGSVVFCLLMFFYFKWYIKRRISTSEILAERQKEVYRLIAEIDSITDRDAQLVEARIKTLRELLEDTDKRIAVYMRELDKSRTGEALYTSLGRGIRAALNQPDISQVKIEPQPAPVAKPVQPAESSQAKAPAARHETKKQIRAQIDMLIKEGLSASEIASRLNIGIAEVDLAMNLLNRGSR